MSNVPTVPGEAAGIQGQAKNVPYYGSALTPGEIDKKFVVFMGLQDQDLSRGTISTSYVPRGTYILSSSDTTIEKGKIKTQGHGYDIVKEFDFEVYDTFPKILFGNQTDVRYDPAYNLTNPSGDLRTWVCDAKVFMTSQTDSKFFQADFNDLFGVSAAINVYVGTATTLASSPVNPSTYTWDPTNGIVLFNVGQPANSVISIDGVPLGMSPELMLKHLFVDKANWDPNALFLDVSNMVLPTYVGGQGRTIWQVAQDIAQMTAPRFVPWQLRINAYGNIFFYEQRLAATPVDTLTDEHDLFTIEHTINADSIINVVRAEGQAANQQQVISLSYDIDSINKYGQKREHNVDAAMLFITRGMYPSKAESFLNMMTASILAANSTPIEELRCAMRPNPLYDAGDKLLIKERRTGLSGPYILRGITETITAGKYSYEGRFEKAKIFANFQMGFPSAVVRDDMLHDVVGANSTGGTVSQTISQNAAVVTGKTGPISTISIGGTECFYNGAQAKDLAGNPIIPIINNGQFAFNFSLDPTLNSDTYVWRFVYMECPNSLSAADAMVVRHKDWIGGINGTESSVYLDGSKIAAATVAGGFAVTTSWSGVTLPADSLAYNYNNLLVGVPNDFLPANYKYSGASIAFADDQSATPTMLGIGLGPSYSGNYAWLPNLKQNYGYFCILCINQAGALQFIRQPFLLQL